MAIKVKKDVKRLKKVQTPVAVQLRSKLNPASMGKHECWLIAPKQCACCLYLTILYYYSGKVTRKFCSRWQKNVHQLIAM